MFWHVFKILAFCLSFINSCVNPLALYFLSRQFRRYYDRYLFCWCRRPVPTTADERGAAALLATGTGTQQRGCGVGGGRVLARTREEQVPMTIVDSSADD